MKLNKTFAYALRAALVLGKLYDGPFVSSKVIAAESGVSGKYLLCVLALLSRQGIVVSTRGFKGGFRLTRSPNDLSLLDIATACGELADDNGRLDDFPDDVADFMRGSLSEVNQKLRVDFDSLKLSDVLESHCDAATNTSQQTSVTTSSQDHATLAPWTQELSEQVEIKSVRPDEVHQQRESA